MAKWIRTSGKPITTESRVSVYSAEHPEIVGYTDTRWNNGRVAFTDAVYSVERVFDKDGCIVEEKKTIIDREPTFN